MLDHQTRPLEVAMKVLRPETIHRVREDENFLRSAYLILDRWALNEPDTLKELETIQNGEILLDRLYEQAEMEKEALSSASAAQMQSQGMTESEILARLDIDTRVRTTASHWATTSA